MRFWDTSAVLPLIWDELSSGHFRRVLSADPAMVVWFFTHTEALGVIAREERAANIDAHAAATARERLERFASRWLEVGEFEAVRRHAERLVRKHALTSADALQLAAALVNVKDFGRGRGFVVVDRGLAHAAEAEGFTVFRAPTRNPRPAERRARR